MTDITISDLTNKTSETVGTGVFDVLVESVKLHLNEEFEKGRLTGAEYSTVYLGALQSVMQQSLTFLLSEQEASKKIELLEKQIEEAAERIDLVAAQTAKVYEDISASQAETRMKSALNSKQIAKIEKDTLLTEAQIADQNYVTDNIRPAELAKLTAETSFTAAKESEALAAITRSDNESVEKIALMQAQTTGFYSDTKQKVLKQMVEGWSVAYTVAGDATLPTYFTGLAPATDVGVTSSAIDTTIQSILNDAQQP